MNGYLQRWYQRISYTWVSYFWQFPNRLMALKVAISISVMMIPMLLIGKPMIGGTLALGVIGGAIAETDDHPKGRIKSLALTIISFLIATISVELLRPHHYLFMIGLVGSTFTFTILGGINERYRGITFGTLLVSIYTMLGMNLGNPWHFQPSFMALGALCFGVVSLLLLQQRPWRPLQEQLSIAYRHLAQYIYIKSKLFPSNQASQDYWRNQLAQKNIEVVQAISSAHKVLRSYAYEVGKQNPELSKYYRQWLILQQLHERATSSHESYDLLSEQSDDAQIIEGLGQLLNQLSKTLRVFAESLLNEKPFDIPVSVEWIQNALNQMMQKHQSSVNYTPLSLLFKNLSEMVRLTHLVQSNQISDEVPSDYVPLSYKQRLKALLHHKHPHFRYAVRLCVCFLLGFACMHYFHIEKGEWILLTALFVCQQNYMSTRQRFVQRVMGTLFGVISGFILIQLLPTLWGNVLMVVLSIYLFFCYTKEKYATAVIFVTITVMALFNIQLHQGVDVILPRITHTFIGAVLAFLSVRFILPDWQYKNLSQLLANALSKNASYFEAIFAENLTMEDYNSIRQKAHQADASLTTAWQSIKIEPKGSKQTQTDAFRLTTLNHSLLSYISAFAAHNRNKEMTPNERLVCQQIVDILHWTEMALGDKPLLSENRLTPREINREPLSRDESENRSSILLYNIHHLAEQLYGMSKTMGHHQPTSADA